METKKREGEKMSVKPFILGKSVGPCLVPSYFRTVVLISATNLSSHPKGRQREKERTEDSNKGEDKKEKLAGVVGCT